MKLETMVGDYTITWKEYPKMGNSGGWSKNAVHRPLPVVYSKKVNVVEYKGKSVYVDGKRKLKFNLFDNTANVYLQRDYLDI